MKLGISMFFVLIAYSVLAQESPKTVLNGKINANTMDLDGIYVINLRTEKSTITEKEGYFTIQAMPGDSLLFSAIQLKKHRVLLTKEDFQKELFFVKMESALYTLNEVVVKRSDFINSVSLGISPSGIKHLTPAERKYATATSGNLNPMGLDPLLNLISGRTAMLKKEIEVEKKEKFLQLIDNMFDQNHFVNILKIPSIYVKGFKYYIVENKRFTTILDTKNKTTIEFLMGQMAEKYNEMILSEK